MIALGAASKLGIGEVFEVLYSPVKAFRKIIDKPDFKALLIVLVLVIASTVLVQYVASSKRFLENRMPENDGWTEQMTNQHYWISSSGVPSLDETDYKMGNADGNHSVASSVQAKSIWMKITDIGSIDSSKETGYTELFFWIKWMHEEESTPNSGTLKLFSNDENSYFETDITSLLASSGEWTNATLNIGPDQGWISNNSPNWQNITGIEFNLNWTSSANLTMKIDGLFFRKFSTSIEMGRFGEEIFFSIFQVGTNWVLLGGILIIVGKLFKEDLGQWKMVFTVVIYVFIATVVINILGAGLISNLPPSNYLWDATATYYYPRNPELWLSNLSYQLLTPLLWIGQIWIYGLSAIIIRLLRETTWSKAATMVAVAFGIRFLLNIFLGV